MPLAKIVTTENVADNWKVMETGVDQLHSYCSIRDETARVQGRIVSPLYRCCIDLCKGPDALD